MRCRSISKSFQNIVNAFSNIDNAFNEMAGHLESFIEPLLSVVKIFTNELLTASLIYQFEFEQKYQIHCVFQCNFCRERGKAW